MFRKIQRFKTRHQILFAIIVGTGVIFFWRGIWGLMDVYLFPNHYGLSSLSSLILGLLILGTTHYIVEELM